MTDVLWFIGALYMIYQIYAMSKEFCLAMRVVKTGALGLKPFYGLVFPLLYFSGILLLSIVAICCLSFAFGFWPVLEGIIGGSK